MTDSAPGRLPGQIHIHLTDFAIALEPGDASHPLRPVVHSLRLRIAPEGLRRLVQGLVDEADRRAPVGIQLDDVRVAREGIDLSLKMAKAIFRSELATRLVLSAPGGTVLRVELADTEMPSWVPLDMLLDEAAKRGGGGVERDPGNRRALLLDPAALLVRLGVPGRFAPGHWDVSTRDDGLDLTFREDSGGG